MYKRPDRKKQLRKLAIIYATMVTAVIGIVAIMVMFVMGYRFDTGDQRFEQTGLVQFNTKPISGAIVEIDKKRIGPKTPAKRLVAPGQHEFAMWQEGYETWWKSLNINAGSLTWLDYARLVPKDRPVTDVKTYETVDQSLFSPGGRFVAVWQDSSKPEFEVVDIRRSDDIKAETIVLDTETLSNFNVEGSVHNFKIDEWDQGGRYLLITHKTGDELDWLIVDRENPQNIINISEIAGLSIQDAQLSGGSGDVAYILTEGSIRRINLKNGELSRTLASRVESFSLYSTDIITYVGQAKSDSHQRVVGVVRPNDTQPHILKTVQAGRDVEFNIDTSRYFNQNYVAISVDNVVEIYTGDYPTEQSRNDLEASSSSMKLLASFNATQPVRWLQFSGNGRFVVAQGDRGFMSYDLERKQASSLVEFSSKMDQQLRWLDSYYLWTVESDQLIMQEYDGANRHTIGSASDGFDVSFDASDENLYSMIRAESGVSLQRHQMILDK